MRAHDAQVISEDAAQAAGPSEEGTALMDRILERSTRLYSLPAVAVDVLRLTANPRVDVAELKACIERDPAMTAKILRVVNSSLYGLSAEVGSLSQAVALLGIKPLKLLVLGFSLPDELFTELAGEQLERYWATSLVRAVAAKAIAERFYRRDGDDAFIAGLIDDIGMLAMLGELGEPYARFLQIVWEQEGDVRALERQSLEFDHGQLTAALLARWKMPEALVRAVAAAGSPHSSRRQTPDETLPQILYLANLTAGLVGRHRLNVLPELLEAGTGLCGLDKPALNALVEELEPKVVALAAALDVRLPQQTNYLQVLAEAQSRMADLGEELAGPLARLDRAEQLLNQLKADQSGRGGRSAVPSHLNLNVVANEPRSMAANGMPPNTKEGRALLMAVERAVAECRSCRDELAVVLIGLCRRWPVQQTLLAGMLAQTSKLLGRACRESGIVHAEQFALSEAVHAFVLPHCTRGEAIELVRQVLTKIDTGPSEAPARAAQLLSAGVASVDTPPRNFEPAGLIESAQRCLSAAQASSGQIKSIELY